MRKTFKLKLDRADLDRFGLARQEENTFTYVTRAGCLQRVVLEIQCGGSLNVRDCTVESFCAFQAGDAGVVAAQEVGEEFLHITVMRRLPMWDRAQATLTQLLAEAPLRRR